MTARVAQELELLVRPALKMSVDRGRPDVTATWPDDAIDPTADLDEWWPLFDDVNAGTIRCSTGPSVCAILCDGSRA